MNESQEKTIEEINQRLKKLISFKMTFLRGVTTGVGTVIGVTLVGAILLTILARVINSVEDIPILEDIINELNIEEALDRSASDEESDRN